MSDTATDIPSELALAVDVLVDAYGAAGAERELQRRFRHGDQDRTSAALSYLRREYPENRTLAEEENDGVIR